MAKVKGMVDKKAVSWDVVTMESADAMRGCDEGILEKLDWKALGGRAHSCPARFSRASWVRSYGQTFSPLTRKKFSGAKPSTINDFFDLKKFPGARGMRKNPKVNLEMAWPDGVAPKDVYKVLATKKVKIVHSASWTPSKAISSSGKPVRKLHLLGLWRSGHDHRV